MSQILDVMYSRLFFFFSCLSYVWVCVRTHCCFQAVCEGPVSWLPEIQHPSACLAHTQTHQTNPDLLCAMYDLMCCNIGINLRG